MGRKQGGVLESWRSDLETGAGILLFGKKGGVSGDTTPRSLDHRLGKVCPPNGPHQTPNKLTGWFEGRAVKLMCG